MLIARRQMLGFSSFAGVASLAGDAEAEQPSDRTVEEIRSAIDELRKAIVEPRAFPELTAVRDQQRAFLRSSGKFPDFIEVGIDVWQAIYDWHVRWQQPVSVARDGNGRYTIALAATTVVLRPDMVPACVGAPFDAK